MMTIAPCCLGHMKAARETVARHATTTCDCGVSWRREQGGWSHVPSSPSAPEAAASASAVSRWWRKPRASSSVKCTFCSWEGTRELAAAELRSKRLRAGIVTQPDTAASICPRCGQQL